MDNTVRTEFRKKSNRHVLNIEVSIPENDKRKLFKEAGQLRLLSNELVAFVAKNIHQMKKTKKYRRLMRDYALYKEKLKGIKKKGPNYPFKKKEYTDILKSTGAQMNEFQQKYNVTFEDLRKFSIDVNKKYNLPSAFVLSRCEDVWNGVEKVLYKDGKSLHLKKRGELPTLRAKQSNRAIILKYDDNGLYCSKKGINDFRIKPFDAFTRETVDKILDCLRNEDVEKDALEKYKIYGEITDTFRPCFCALKCETIRGKLRVFLQITIEGKALSKKDKSGNLRHKFATNKRGGCDIGTQTYALYTHEKIVFKNLSECNNKCTKTNEPKEKGLQRQIDRSKRLSNPNKYNEDGTCKTRKENSDPWKFSNSCKKKKQKLKALQRRNRLNRKYAINEDVNNIRKLCDVIITEPSNTKQLQRKAKKDPENPAKKRKRFGRSVLHRCSGGFFARLKEVFENTDGIFLTVDNFKFKASQYNHINNTYKEKKLSQRWHRINKDINIQRDIYSAFLLYCAGDDLLSPDREKCFAEFDNLLWHHNCLVTYIKENKINICNSGIKVA